MPAYETFGERLRYARERVADLTQAELSALTGVPQPTISKLERTPAISSKFCVQLAKGCGVNPEWLATGRGPAIDAYSSRDIKIQKAMEIMQSLPPSALDHAIKQLSDTAQFIRELDREDDEQQPDGTHD